MSESTMDTIAPRQDVAEVDPQPGSTKPDPILTVDTMVRRFGGLVAVDVDHLEVQRNWITALIGPNGAGKTTFFNLLTGFDKPSSGVVEFNGDKLPEKVSPEKLANDGMVRTFQLTKSLTRLSVIENMRLGAQGQLGERFLPALFKPAWSDQEDEITTRADELLERFNMTHMREEFAGTLSGGQRKLLEMARSLMTHPTLVMLDEPMAGVNPALTQTLLEHVKDLRDQGMTVIFVEHDMDVVHEIADWVVVMAEGRIIAEGTPKAISKNKAVVDAYLGSHHGDDLEFDAEGNPIYEKHRATAEEAEIAAKVDAELDAEERAKREAARRGQAAQQDAGNPDDDGATA
ncbi:MAG TPA: ABC transporter ATP-binding protein [Nitriliruptoraceae bacterium]|nr:ABC transporter ATP-binding protein [Nitriliruptoraceae bacterium]